MTFYQWLTLGLGAVGFLLTWTGMWFGIGRAVEQMKAALKKDINDERDRIVEQIKELEDKFEDDQRTQDHRYGEVSAAMRQYIADIEKHVREVEIWGRDNYVQKPEFTAAMDRFRADLKDAVAEIKKDLREIVTRQ